MFLLLEWARTRRCNEPWNISNPPATLAASTPVAVAELQTPGYSFVAGMASARL
jgi:hypothetical protein